MSVSINEEKVKNRLEEILEKIQAVADPDLLNQYRSLFRKEVSFFRRSYVAAYLLMIQDQGSEGGRSRKNSGTAFKREQTPVKGKFNSSAGRDVSAAAEKPLRSSGTDGAETSRHPLPEDESIRLFISIGRNRRVYPREILGLICAKTEVPKEDIGIINILNNYSFVQVRTNMAEEIIAALNGINFRGRTLTVNFARTRKEEDGETAKFFEDPSEQSSKIAAETEQETSDEDFDDMPEQQEEFTGDSGSDIPDEAVPGEESFKDNT
jgi:hypothetical protein